MSDVYRIHGDTFETIHDFFRGSSRSSAREIGRLIRAVAKYIDGLNDMKWRSVRLKELVAELVDLSQEVLGEAIYDSRMYARLPQGGLYRRTRFITY